MGGGGVGGGQVRGGNGKESPGDGGVWKKLGVSADEGTACVKDV